MEKRLFEDLIDSDRVKHRTHQSRTLPVSLALHAFAAAVIVLVPLLAADQMPEPASAVRAFFVEPMAAPVAPPPPPPPAPRAPDAPKITPKPVVQNNGLPDAPPPPPQQAVRVGGQIKEPKKLKNVNPAYPDIAKQARVQGVVILECTISPQGKVSDVKVLRGIPLLDQAAIDAVKQWVYTPTLLNGVPVPVIMTVTVNFKLS
jgi:protein TonB